MNREEQILEAARERAERHQIAEIDKACTHLYSYSRVYNTEIASFEAGVEWADKNPKSPWINVKNELPNKCGSYICIDENQNISNLTFCGDKWVNTTSFIDIPLEIVKYWMPIPKIIE